MPTRQPTSQPWQFLTEDAQAILFAALKAGLEGLREAEFDPIYPSSPALFDRFLAYLDEVGVRQTLEGFPDPRAGSVPSPCACWPRHFW